MTMTKEEILGKVVLTTDSSMLSAIEEILTGKGNVTTTVDRTTLNYRQAAEALGICRTTVRRLLNEGRLKSVETRLGRKRILNQSITDFVAGVKYE